MTDEIMEDSIGDEEVETDQYLVFTVKSREFGVQAMRVQEISSVSDITDVPNAPPYIEGIMNLRGQLASVINFRKKFGFESKEHDEDTRIFIVEHRGYPIGIIVDSVEEVIRIPDEAVQKMPESPTAAMSKEYLMGVGMLGSRMIILLDVDNVLTKAESIELGRADEAMNKTGKMPENAEGDNIDSEQHPVAKKQKRKRRTG